MSQDDDREHANHVLACLSNSASNQRVLYEAAHLAKAFQCTFTAFFVETTKYGTQSQKQRIQLQQNLSLAKKLGGQVITAFDGDIATQIVEYAKESNVTKIVLGRHKRVLPSWKSYQSLTSRICRKMPDVTVFMVPDSSIESAAKKKSTHQKFKLNILDMLKNLLTVTLATCIGVIFNFFGLEDPSIMSVYLLCVLIAALWSDGPLYGAFNAILSVMAFNFFFVDPYLSMEFYSATYPITFLVMFIVSCITNSLTQRVKDQARHAARKAYRTQILLETNQKLQNAESFREIVEATVLQIKKLLQCAVVFYPVDALHHLCEGWQFPLENQTMDHEWYSSVEQSAAQWALANNQPAGATTHNFSDAQYYYQTVCNQGMIFGVIGVNIGAEDQQIDEYNILFALINECSVAIEKNQLAETKKQMELKAEQEQLRANMLRMISHDLRTPLTSISGNAGILMSSADKFDASQRYRLYSDIYDDAIWLISLVENVLSITRMESTVQLHMEPELMEEVFCESLQHLDRQASEHEISIDLENDLLMAKMDAQLIKQVIVNIVNNAIKYAGKEAKVMLSAKAKGKMVEVSIADNGVGIPDDEKENMFTMFYTSKKHCADGRRGLGIGLALCKAIITLHHGTIQVKDHQPQGAVFSFTLPMAEVECYE